MIRPARIPYPPDPAPARAALALVSEGEAVAEVIDLMEAAERRRQEREERANREWRPPLRCSDCWAFVAPSRRCALCGGYDQEHTEGARNSARRRPRYKRKALRR